jgi:uncharacterized protein (TIGR02271 family)
MTKRPNEGSAETPNRGTVVDAEGLASPFVEVEDDASPDEVRAAVELENGRRILVPRSLLLPQTDGTFFIPLSLNELAGTAARSAAGESQVISLAEEQVTIGKRRVVTRKVRVNKRVNETQELVDVPLLKEQVEVRHVPVTGWLDAPLSTRQEGDTIIMPIMEEVLVLEKRLRLIEEVHVIKHRRTIQHREEVPLRHETADVEQIRVPGGEVEEKSEITPTRGEV